jgi:MraZ protein
MDGFVATFTNRLDQKGRVSVPASFRAALTREGFDGVYCYPALDQPAIDAGGSRLRSAIDQRLSVFETFSEDYEILSTAFYGASRVLKIDKDGRITLPDDLREDAGITDTLVFVGQGFKFQIWEPGRFAARKTDARARLKEVTRGLGRRPSPAGEA